MNLLDLLTNEAIERAGNNADQVWVSSAYKMVEILAKRGEPFTTDDVWDLLNEYGVPPTHEPRALGAVMRQAKDNKLIAPTLEYRVSKRIECHKNPKRVWKPL